MAWGLDGIPSDFNGRLLAPDWEQLAPLLEDAIRRIPALASAEVVRLIHGPEAFTPDGEFILGEAPEAARLLRGRRLLRPRIAGAGGAGPDHGRLDRRTATRGSTSGTWTSAALAPSTASRRLVHSSGPRVYATYYDILYPDQEGETGAGSAARRSTPRLRELGAVFGEKAGWERANWFEPNAAAGARRGGRAASAGRVWSPAIEAEHRATRERVALFDETSFAKLRSSGRARSRSSSGSPPTTWTGPRRGDLHLDAQRARGASSATSRSPGSAADRFRIVTGSAFGPHDPAGSPPTSRVTARCRCGT